jgi:hypothetical protein
MKKENTKTKKPSTKSTKEELEAIDKRSAELRKELQDLKERRIELTLKNN